ncbi:kinase-like domain-containing protein [Rhizophagus irregularis DAOM 181602=DAOM 197198]|nr:kinase-like domain-containing protein [Rhizophagus irregularis DAOM 181602=DAOM 197198]
MSDNKQKQNSENTNEWINWVEEAIVKEHLKFYEYNQFSNFQQIGVGSFGIVYRANWKNLEKHLALKSFFSLDNITVKEIVRELKIQRKVDLHDNIIRCHGITKLEPENHHGNVINYMLVMEYADGGSLRNYLKNNFSKLTWNDKYLMAYQLSSAVSYLHVEGVVHRDLHSSNILVHQNTIKLADFGLILEISQGLRETVVPDTPDEYIKIYTKCWDGEPNNRPTIFQVVDWLKVIVTKTDIIIENPQLSNNKEFDKIPSSINNSESQGELSRLINYFNKMSTKEIYAIAES